MRSTKRLVTALLAIVFSLAIAAIAVFATQEDERKVPAVKAHTLSLSDSVHILYAVDFGELGEGAEYGMLAWIIDEDRELPSSLTHENASSAINLKSQGTSTVSGAKCHVFRLNALAARQMTDWVYAVPYVKHADDTAYTYGTPTKYSILQYTLGSAATEENRYLLDAMLEYGAAAQEYYGYKLDRLASDEYVLAKVTDGAFADGFTHSIYKPGEKVTVSGGSEPLVSGASKITYISTIDGRGLMFHKGEDVLAPDSAFTVSHSVAILEETFNTRTNNASGKYTGGGELMANNKGSSTYTVITEANGNKYIKHVRADGSGNDSQSDSSNGTLDIQDHLYDHTTSSFADKKLTLSIKLARTDAAVAAVKFNLRHYVKYASSGREVGYTTSVFTLNSAGTVLLGGSVPVASLCSEFIEFSFVVDFGAGDLAGADNLFAYAGGTLIGAMRVDSFNTENFLVHTDDIERLITNFHSSTNTYGELLYDDLLITLGATPMADTPLALINYNVGEGTLPADAPTFAVPGTTVVLPTPEKENYTFEGWFTSAAFTEDSRISALTPEKAGTVTLYAKFLPSASYIESLKAKNESFLTSDFYRVDTDNYYNLSSANGGVSDHYSLVDYGEDISIDHIIKLDTTKYEPYAKPQEGISHPYLFFTSDDIDAIRAILADPEFSKTAEKFWSYANAKDFTGEFPEGEKNGVKYRWSTTVLAQLEAKALAYLLTGDASYGYEAIIGAKNAMLTLVYTPEQHMDPYHGASQTMLNVAKVYDWCYDLLTEKDKTELILGVQNLMCPTMEYNYFRKDQGLSGSYPTPSPVSGHGTGPQFIRDYVTVALAFYTEESSWWDFIGGRYIAEYAPVMEVCYEGGWASQGTATYGTSKYFINLWAAWVIRSATGVTLDYATEEGGAREAAYFLNSHIMGNDRYFSTGDGGRNSNGSAINFEYMLLAAAFYQDPALEAFARYYTGGYSKWTYDFTEEMTAPMTLVFASFFADEVEGEYENRGDGVDLIMYFSSPNGFSSARDSWDSDSASVIMKIGELSMFNHDIADHGTFQIYYKGMLATSSGAYNKYGSNVHRYYLQSTVAQNGLLIHNPTLADADPVVDANGNVTNGARYYYSGGQRGGDSGSTLDAWLDGHSVMGEVTGHSEAYYSDGSSHYAYIAGDITSAYNLSTVDYVGRRMLTIFTGDESYPMLFFTFDRMSSDSASFAKTFLLHTVNEPTINESTMSAEITDGEGTLVLHSLTGAKTITKVGGEGKAYWINGYYDENENWVEGKNLLDAYTTADNYDKIWGRLELGTRGNRTDSLLTAMYVTDTANTERLEVQGYKTEDVHFATVMDRVIVFADSENAIAREFSIGVKGEGLYTYYVSGITAGIWTVRVNGTDTVTVTVTDEAEFFTFVAPTGRIEFIPDDSITGDFAGAIRYSTGGGTLPEDAPKTYSPDSETVLPTPVRGNDVFLGWYMSENMLDGERLTKIPAGLSGSPITVYAKWQKALVNENYESTKVNVPESTTSSFGGITYNAGSANELKPGSTHTTVEGSNGNTYLRITAAGKNSCVYASNGAYNLTHFTETAISYEFDVAKLSGYSTANLQLMLTTSGGSYGTLGNILTFTTARKYTFFGDYDTTVKLANSKTVSAITLSESFTKIRLTIDFAASTVTLYDASGKSIASASLSVPNPASGNTKPANLAQWQKLAQPIFFRFEVTKSSEGDSCALAFDNIKVYEGKVWDRTEDKIATNFISYNANGGTLTPDAPVIYSTTESTVLPTKITKAGCVFGGWYTDPTFKDGTRITEIPKNTSGTVNLYAKWQDAYAFVNFDGTEVNNAGTASTVGALTYNARNPGCSLYTDFDAAGNYYLTARNTQKAQNSIVYKADDKNNLTTFTNTAISYQIDLRKERGVNLSSFSISIATSGSAYGMLSVASMDAASGNVKLQGGSKVLCTVNEDSFVTLRITVDFAAGLIIAYDENGNELDRVSPKVPTSASGNPQPSTLAEWQKVAASYVFYASIVNNTDTPTTSIELDNITIVDGRAFL